MPFLLKTIKLPPWHKAELFKLPPCYVLWRIIKHPPWHITFLVQFLWGNAPLIHNIIQISTLSYMTISFTGSDNEFYQGHSWIESEFGFSDELFTPLEQRVVDLGAGDHQQSAMNE